MRCCATPRGLSRVLPMVTEAADNVGDPAVQARGTLGGALAHSDPAADFTAIFLALNGSVDVTGAQGSRTIAADELFVDLFTTALQPDEIITSVSFPAPAPGTGNGVREISPPGLRLRSSRCGGRGRCRLRWDGRLGADRRHRGDEQGDACCKCRTGPRRKASRRRVDRGRGGSGRRWARDQRRPFRVGGVPKAPRRRADRAAPSRGPLRPCQNLSPSPGVETRAGALRAARSLLTWQFPGKKPVRPLLPRLPRQLCFGQLAALGQIPQATRCLAKSLREDVRAYSRRRCADTPHSRTPSLGPASRCTPQQGGWQAPATGQIELVLHQGQDATARWRPGDEIRVLGEPARGKREILATIRWVRSMIWSRWRKARTASASFSLPGLRLM